MNLADNSCVDVCPADTTVRQGNQCIGCDENCKTCSAGDAMDCTACQNNLVLYADEPSGLNRCKLTCEDEFPDATERALDGSSQVAVDGTCQPCREPCKRCSGTVDHCTECKWPAYFWSFQCLEDCSMVEHPRGYPYKTNDDRRCIIDGLNCDFGYIPEPITGDSCVVGVQVCEDGAMLTEDKTRCVPGS
jgi:hypothetical protein